MPDKPKHEPYDSPLRWLIESKTDGHASYVVDLGMMECQCKFHRMDVSKKLRLGQRPKMCTHYYIARERFTCWAIYKFDQVDPNKNHDQNL